jgi:4-amino-4-deoxy-L-arabinose transferase-like glycosyltransferase
MQAAPKVSRGANDLETPLRSAHREYIFVTLSRNRPVGQAKRGIGRWRSTGAAAFVRRFNGAPETESWSAAFPRRLRWPLALSIFGVTLAALLVRAPFLGTGFSAPDTAQYLEVAKGVFHGGYSSNLRPPGYATLLAIFELLGVNPVDAVVTFQNLIGIALPACVLVVGWRFFGPLTGIAAGFLAAASPLMIAVEQFALSDYLFGVLLFAAAAVLAEAALRARADRYPWRLLLLAGALFGVATLFRANGLFGLVAIPAVLLSTGKPWRPKLRAAAMAIGAMAIVLAPWCIHNWIRFNDPNVASEGGISLYARAVSYDEVPPSTDTANGRLANRVYNTGDPNKREAAVGTTLGTYNAFIHQTGKTPVEAAGAMGQVARDAILSDFGKYLERSIEILGRYQAVFDPHTLTADPKDQIATTRGYIDELDPSAREAPGDSGWTRALWQIAQALTKVLFVATIGGLLILALPFLGNRRGRVGASALLIVGLLDILFVTLTARFEMRHVIVLAPIIWILAPATLELTLRLLGSLVRQRSSAGARIRAQGATS